MSLDWEGQGEDFMANFRYEVKSTQSEEWLGLGTGDYDKFKSKCGDTMAGVVRNRSNNKFKCMVGH